MEEFTNAGICLISEVNENKQHFEDSDLRQIDIGNFYKDKKGKMFLITSREKAKKYNKRFKELYKNIDIMVFKKEQKDD